MEARNTQNLKTPLSAKEKRGTLQLETNEEEEGKIGKRPGPPQKPTQSTEDSCTGTHPR